MSNHNESYQSLSQWETRPNGQKHTSSVQQFQQFAASYPQSDDCTFLPARDAASTIQTNPQVMEKSYFRSYCPGLDTNVPIPLHPELVGMPIPLQSLARLPNLALNQTKTPFYTHYPYLLRVCKPFKHVNGLETLTEANLNSDYRSGGLLGPQIRQALGKGHPVLVQQCGTRFKGVDISIDSEDFCKLTFQKDSDVEAQDMVHWSTILHLTYQAFWDHMYDPREILNLLDMNSHLREGRPLFMAGIYDDPSAARTVRATLPVTISDLIRYPQWMLLGHPFSHTFGHNDSSGLSTYVIVVEGRKLWFILRWTQRTITPEMWHHRWKCMMLGEFFALEYTNTPPWAIGKGPDMTIDYALYSKHKDTWETYRVAEWVCADLTPGMALIMPPCTLHWVSKPLMTLSTGGHGLISECMPLTEIGCRMDRLSSVTTNDVHPSMPAIHAALALQLPENPENAITQGWSRRQLESLVRLVLLSNRYRQELVKSDADKRYNKIPINALERTSKRRMELYRTFLNLDISEMPLTYSPPETAPVTAFEWATIQT
ncbi:hypothetical protein FRC00_003674 [Tulasnella sp. 408]|nr:hypothetical protein FRC00_003674 [Tulasnella sp. 408]